MPRTSPPTPDEEPAQRSNDRGCLASRIAFSGRCSTTPIRCRCLYNEVHTLASSMLRCMGRNAMLDAEDLTQLAFVRLLAGRGPGWDSRAHFFGSAARAMEQVLIDHLRTAASRRDMVPLADSPSVSAADPRVADLSRAVRALELHDGYLGALVRLRACTDLTLDQIAEALGVAARTLDRDWAKARAWIKLWMAQQRL